VCKEHIKIIQLLIVSKYQLKKIWQPQKEADSPLVRFLFDFGVIPEVLSTAMR